MEFFNTERLIIRRFTPDDWKDLYEYLSNEKVVFYEPYGVFSEDACKGEAINRANSSSFWAVCLKNNKVIGNLYLGKQDFNTWELGYVFNEKYHKNGYAAESAKAIISYAFNELKARRIVAMCNPQNIPSWKLLERLGMRREGHLLQNIYFKKDENNQPIWQDTYEYGILHSEWVNNNQIMDIVKGQKQDISDIFNIISNCIKHMESQGVYQWNKFYPNVDIIQNDIDNEHCYALKDNGKCIAYVAINEEQSPEYSQIKWSSDGRKVLVIHRLCVHPEFQGKGIAKKMLHFIEAIATKNNYSCIRFDAYSGNETALKLYENFGYKKAGQVYFPWRDLPFYCYEKNI